MYGAFFFCLLASILLGGSQTSSYLSVEVDSQRGREQDEKQFTQADEEEVVKYERLLFSTRRRRMRGRIHVC